MVMIMKQVYEEEGIAGYYKGFVATMLNTFSMREYPPELLIPPLTLS